MCFTRFELDYFEKRRGPVFKLTTVALAAIEETCDTGNHCTTTGTICTSGKCGCDAGYVREDKQCKVPSTPEISPNIDETGKN